MKLDWSVPIQFDQVAIRHQVPTMPGVYEILQDLSYARYRGTTPVLKIGKSDRSIQDEVLNHFQRHTAANRLTRVRNQSGMIVTVVFVVVPVDDVGATELMLLREFEDQHWDLPLLNAQRGYGRDEDRHFRQK